MSVLIHGVPRSVGEVRYDSYRDLEVFNFQLAHENAPKGTNGEPYFETIEAPARMLSEVAAAAKAGSELGLVVRPTVVVPKDDSKRPWVKLRAVAPPAA